MPPGPTPLWGPGAVPGEWTNVWFCQVPELARHMEVEVWLHLDLVSNRHAYEEQRVLLTSSHDPPMEPRAYVEPGSGTDSVFTHIPKDPNCEICLKTKITRASGRRRANAVVPRAEIFGDLITADHKVLSEESESRSGRRYAVVVQDLATQWLQSCPCKTKTSQETSKNLMKFLELFLNAWSCRFQVKRSCRATRMWVHHVGKDRP